MVPSCPWLYELQYVAMCIHVTTMNVIMILIVSARCSADACSEHACGPLGSATCRSGGSNTSSCAFF
jgi:hypothetical protein